MKFYVISAILVFRIVDAKEGVPVNATVSMTISPSSNTTTSAIDRSEPIIEVKRAIEEKELVEKNKIDEVKEELDKAVHSLNKTIQAKGDEVNGAVAGVSKSLESCVSVDCNNRGTCLGTKRNFLCACQLGYSGKTCEETVCDSRRDCNGRGLCFGTTNTLTCLCNLGFTGPRCETLI
ncbi:unnamed protein product [Caenorhabditis auriculariae]|uniref:EGF-like domain-containing protein n=1 Tax=Caenorhabditis auriculariae TaxID=2777116 RepID=A0A8S1HNS3_9PELO|nr:unnamed protein product [Caenorhabditis auriculariae]